MKESLEKKHWSFFKRAFYRFFISFAPIILRFYFNITQVGLDNVDVAPEGTPVIFCCNHRSHLDSLIFGCLLARPNWKRRFMAFMASGKVMERNNFYRLVRFFGAFPVFSNNPKTALNYAFNSLKIGLALYLTPQGMRVARTVYEDYKNLHKEGQSGVGRLILKMNGKIPVLPVYIKGTAEALKKGQIIPKFKSKIFIRFGEALDFTEYYKKNGWVESDRDFYKKAREITNTIMSEIKSLLIKTEKCYLSFLEFKLGKPIKNINIDTKNSIKARKFLNKLGNVDLEIICDYLKSKKHLINEEEF